MLGIYLSCLVVGLAVAALTFVNRRYRAAAAQVAFAVGLPLLVKWFCTKKYLFAFEGTDFEFLNHCLSDGNSVMYLFILLSAVFVLLTVRNAVYGITDLLHRKEREEL